MRSPTGREVQVFVAGALALDGLHTLIAFMRGLIPTSDRTALAAGLIAALALPLGIAILMKSTFALRIAYIYLGLAILLACVTVVGALCITGTAIFHYSWVRRFSTAVVIQLILLLLLVWSCSRRLRDESAV
jgi:hypothetical protein